MKSILEFIFGVIILIVLWHNLDKVIEIGDYIVNIIYNLIMGI